MDVKKSEYLKKIYTDLSGPSAYAGVDKLYRLALEDNKFKISRHFIIKWLNNLDSYSMRKGLKQNFSRRRVLVSGINDQMDSDLMDMSKWSKYNSGIKYLMICIDLFSRKAFVYALKTKTSEEVIQGFKKAFQVMGHYRNLRTDPGGEYKSLKLAKFMSENKVNHFFTYNETIKANYAERFIRSLRNLISRYLIENHTYDYLSVLDQLVESYNSRPHRSLANSTPNSVNKGNEAYFRTLFYGIKKPQKHKNKKFSYKVGDKVRISSSKKIFSKDIDLKWTEEVFLIKSREFRQGFAIYTLTDLLGDDIHGSFYSQELLRVQKSDDALYIVDKILKRKKKNKKPWVYVAWRGYKSKFNTWIPLNNVKVYG